MAWVPRLSRRIAFVAVALALGALLTEAGLQLAARFVDARSSAWRPDARNRVLCVGDSHTYGAGVPRDAGYPARLQALLDTEEPAVHSLINMGLPGLSSTQLAHRLPDWMQRYRPSGVIVWVGVNNSWNRAEVESDWGGPASRIDAWLIRSRLWRLVRVSLHARKLARYVLDSREDRAWHVVDVEGEFRDEVWTVRHDGVTEVIKHGEHVAPPGAPDERADEMRARLERDLVAMVDYARAADTPIILVTFPLEVSWYALVNRVMRRLSRERGVPLVETAFALARVPEEERDWTGIAHPGPRIYREIAHEVAPLVAAIPEGRLYERFPPRTPLFRSERPHVWEPVIDASGRVVLADPAAGSLD